MLGSLHPSMISFHLNTSGILLGRLMFALMLDNTMARKTVIMMNHPITGVKDIVKRHIYGWAVSSSIVMCMIHLGY